MAKRPGLVPVSLQKLVLVLLALGALATVPYLPVLVQPFVSDDYVQIDLGRKYGPVAAWDNLMGDALYRCRATSIVVTYWTEKWFGTGPLPFYSTSVALHVLNTWLVLLVGWRLGFGRVRSLLAAGFFAVYLGHQEAVMWYAALPELLLFLFCGFFLLSWNEYVRRGSAAQYGLALVWFALALLSKEAGVVLAPVAAAMAYKRGRSIWRAAPLGVLAALYAMAIFAAKANHLHLNDGTFSLHAPFLLVWAKSIARLFWVWGLAGSLAVLAWRRWEWRRLLPAALWIGVALLPFSFLLYMPVVPSRHTYLASAGLGFFVAAGLLAARLRFREQRWVLPLLLMAIIGHHTGYIWGKKRGQFLQRAAATEDLLRLAKDTEGPIYVTCFPYGRDVAEKALEIALPHRAAILVWDSQPPPDVVTYCAPDP